MIVQEPRACLSSWCYCAATCSSFAPSCMAVHKLGALRLQVATAVADQAFKQGVARIKRPADLKAYIEHRM